MLARSCGSDVAILDVPLSMKTTKEVTVFTELTDALLDLRSQTLGRAAQPFAVQIDCCSSSCCSCWPYPLCLFGW
jgi:hypothetical protein